MADTKLTALTELTAPALDDWLYAVDKSDTTDDAAGSSRKILNSTLLQYVPHGLSEISVTGATTATIGRMHVCSGTTADYTLTLPAASGNTGKVIVVRMATGLTKLVTIDGNASETIDGSLTRIMWAGESAILLCDGSNWFKIGGESLPMYCDLARSTAQSFTSNSWSSGTVLFTSQSAGLSQMYDSGNSRTKIVRPGRYIANGGIYWTGTSMITAYVAVFKTATAALIANAASIISGTSSQNTISLAYDCVVDDYIHLAAYSDGSSLSIAGQTIAATISVTEVPKW